VALMWKITTRGFTLWEVLIMAAMNVASPVMATDKVSERLAQPRAPRFKRLQEKCHGKGD
jgi:hypothetical protein